MPRNKGPLTSDQARAMKAARKTHGHGGGRPQKAPIAAGGTSIGEFPYQRALLTVTELVTERDH